MKTKILLSVFLFCSVLFSYGQWTYSSLSTPKLRMGTASLGNKAYFAGGDDTLFYSNAVEIFDAGTGTWTNTNLSFARMFPTGVSCGSKVFFAGGTRIPVVYDIVDIYDTLTQQWTVEHLLEARFSIAAASKGNKVIFAGGMIPLTNSATALVEIYDIQTGFWNYSSLSQARGSMGVAVVGDLAFFAGGYDGQFFTNQVDIYNFSTSTWSSASLFQARGFLASAAVGNKVLFAGGMTDPNDPLSASDRVDIYNASTGTWDTASLSFPRAFFEYGVGVNNKAYFAGGGNFDCTNKTWTTSSNVVDVYDDFSGSWTVMNLTHDLMNHSVSKAGDYLLVAGGASLSNMVLHSTVEIYIDPTTGINTKQKEESTFSVYPNPSSGNFHLQMPDNGLLKTALVTLYNMQGQLVLTQSIEPGDNAINALFPDGAYLLKVITQNETYTELISIQN